MNEAYDGLGATYNLYSEVYGRNSIDDRGMRLDASVHFADHYDNAFWDGQQMVFGDGDEIMRSCQEVGKRIQAAILSSTSSSRSGRPFL